MLDPESAVISCPGPDQMEAACAAVIARLAPDVARQLRHVRNEYLIAYDWPGVFERLNGRTVAQVLAEFREPAGSPAVAEGDVDGVRFALYEAPTGGRRRGGILGRLRRLWAGARPAAPADPAGQLAFRADQGGFRDEHDFPFCLVCGVSGPDAAGAGHYLTFQRSPERDDPARDDGVYCEVDDRRNGEFNGVRRCRLTRAAIEVDLGGRPKAYTGVSVDVSALDDETFAAIRDGLRRIFRGTDGVLDLAEPAPAGGG